MRPQALWMRREKRLMRHAPALVIATALLAVTGCATVVDGDMQVVVVKTSSGGNEVAGALCVLANPQGESRATTPGRVLVHSAFDDLKIQCQKAGFEPRETVVKSEVNPKLMGNVLIGGAIGFGLDHISGSAYRYPATVVVDLGELPAGMHAAVETPRRRADAARESMQRALAGDERRSVELVRRTACHPAEPPVLMRQESGMNQFVTRCQDGRIAHTVCRQAECRFQASDD
jgi:hypothetical protein